MSEQPVFIVTTGEYSDYRIRGAFLDEDAANAYALRVGGEVETFPIRERSFVPGRTLTIWTRIGARSGDIERTWESADERDAVDEWPTVTTNLYTTSLPTGPALHHTVTTQGDVTEDERIRKSHAEHVAKKRAEVMGL